MSEQARLSPEQEAQTRLAVKEAAIYPSHYLQMYRPGDEVPMLLAEIDALRRERDEADLLICYIRPPTQKADDYFEKSPFDIIHDLLGHKTGELLHKHRAAGLARIAATDTPS